MNLNLIQLIGKYVMFLTVSFMSFFNTDYNEKVLTINNNNIEKDGTIVNTITDFKTIVKYNSKLPSNVTNVITEGVSGLSIKDSNGVQVIQEVVDKVVEKGTGAYGIYKGKLVGYGPDCPGCSSEGYVSCKTESKDKFSLIHDGVYYNDDEYGKVRIVAAALTKFPCGTIVEVTNPKIDPFTVIVMDTGGTVIKAWKNYGAVVMDLAYSKNALASSDGLTGNNITFKVQRWGW